MIAPKQAFICFLLVHWFGLGCGAPVCADDVGTTGFVAANGAFDDFTGDAEVVERGDDGLSFSTSGETRALFAALEANDDIVVGQRGTFTQRDSWIQFVDSDGLIAEFVSGGEGTLPNANMVITDESAGPACVIREGKLREPLFVKVGSAAESESATSLITIGARSYRFVVFHAAVTTPAPLAEYFDPSRYAEAMLIRQAD
jgi:hypothetical protein